MRLVALQTAIVYGVLLAGGICLAQQTVTVKGVTYVDAELIKEYPHSVYISHTAGRGFINKADLTAQQAQVLGVSAQQAGSGSAEQSESFVLPDALSVNGVIYQKPVYRSHNEFALQISHDAGVASLRIAELPADVQKGLNYNPEAGAKAEEAHLNSQQDLLARQQAEKRRALEAKQQAAEEAKITSDEIRARDLQRSREDAVQRAESDHKNLARPREIKRPSPLASNEEKAAYRARLTMQAIERGEATVADLPESYGGRPTGNTRRAIAAREAWDRNQAIEMENRLMEAGRISEAAALRQMRLQEEGNNSLEKVAIEVERLRQDFDRDRWRRGDW